MRLATATLHNLINQAIAGNQFHWCEADLYTFTNAAGTVLGTYTTADIDMPVNLNGSLTSPTVYQCPNSGAPLLKRGGLKFEIGSKVGSMGMTLMADATKTIGGIPWLQALRTGIMDGGRVSLYRYLSDSFTDTTPGHGLNAGAVILFSGQVGQMDAIGRSKAQFTVNDDRVRLNVQMPRELQQAQCANLLYDSKCTLNPNSFKQSGTIVLAGSTRQTLNTSSLTQPTPYWALGKIQFISGPNSGSVYTIRSQPGTNQVSLVVPLWQSCTNGDSFIIYAGCDHTQATCASSKFNNVINFRGAPYTPTPEMVT